MTEGDIIRVNGWEYELAGGPASAKLGPNDLVILTVRPKRKQTGWVCRECGGYCLRVGENPIEHKPERGVYRSCGEMPVWVPYYGKVVEE